MVSSDGVYFKPLGAIRTVASQSGSTGSGTGSAGWRHQDVLVNDVNDRQVGAVDATLPETLEDVNQSCVLSICVDVDKSIPGSREARP